MSSGTSFADLIHQAWDSAAQASGLSAVGEEVYGQTQDGAETDHNQDQSQGKTDTNGTSTNQGNGAANGNQSEPYHAAPGNHPNDPDARINHPDAVNGKSSPAQSKQDGHPHVDNDDSKANAAPDKKDASTDSSKARAPKHEDDMGQSVIERALGDEGLTAQRQGTIYDKQLENEMDGSYKKLEKTTKPEASAVELGQPIQSERNQTKDGHGGHHKKDELSPEAHQEHAADRGPSWASRPDDKQRAKIAKMKEEQAAGTWKRRFSSFGPNSDQSAPSTPKGKNREEDKEKGSGLFGSRPDHTRPALNIFSSTRRNAATQDQDGDASGGAGNGKGKQQDSGDRKNDASRSSSKWADNSNKMRNAFDQGGDDDSNDQQGGNDQVPTPELSPDDQKMRAITKIMLGGKEGEDSTTQDGAGPSGSAGGPQQAQTRWAQLKKKVRESQKVKREQSKSGAVALDLAKELQTGILPVFLLKMAVERDEAKRRRIPVLLNHLRLRVTDSVNPMHNTHAVFRIELEYGDGLVKWVIYRELRDFLTLHAHYRAAAVRGYLGRINGSNTEGDVGLPSFPKMSLPYFNQLQRQGKTSRADFARAQRDALENYIIELIRRTMFRAEANRLCKFFEISALSVSLASRGGHQGKQGYLRILSRSSRKKDQKSILTPARWAKAYEPKWFIVRESFIAIVDEPDSLQLYDVFFMDNDFKIERPKRLYKQTMHIAHKVTNSDEKKGDNIESSEQPESGGKEASYDQQLC